MSEIWYTILIILGPFAWRRFNTWRIQRNRITAAEQLLNNVNNDANGGGNGNASAPTPHPMTTNVPGANPVPPLVLELTPILRFIILCLVIHTFLVAFDVAFNPPTNIFSALKVPVTISVSRLREKIMNASESTVLPPHLEFLLKRLQSFDTRSYYIRFGHESVTTCTHCVSHYDYLVYYIPKVTTQYLRMAFLMAIMTIKGSGKRKWRRWAIASVVGCWMAEMWTVATMDIIIPRDGLDCEMWHDRIWYLRQAYFFFTPLVLHFLPYTYLPLSPFLPLYPTLGVMESLIMKIRLLDDVRISTQRSDTLRARTGQYWKQQATEAEFARNDPEVKLEAERLGLGYAELLEDVEEERGSDSDADDATMSDPVRLRVLSRGMVAALVSRLETLIPKTPREPPPNDINSENLSEGRNEEVKVEGT